MIVEADTPQGSRTGSSVMEVYAAKRIALTSEEAEISDGLRGEAVTVDLPGGSLFALLKTADGSRLDLHRAVTVALSGRMFTSLPDLSAMVGKLGGAFAGSATAELPRTDWPLFVRFRDMSDPTSVERVEPDATGIRRILVETTGDAVTQEIQKRLRWLTDGGLTLNVNGRPSVNPPFAGTIYQREFKTELER